MLVGLNIVDDAKYQEYRENMQPILSEYGGGFNYDFKISEVLLTETGNDINRVFTIYFPYKPTVYENIELEQLVEKDDYVRPSVGYQKFVPNIY